jgi:hypothetical protein
MAGVGADVIKIERPEGEELRRFPPQVDGESAVYALLNRGKKSIVLYLKAQDEWAPVLAAAGCCVRDGPRARDRRSALRRPRPVRPRDRHRCREPRHAARVVRTAWQRVTRLEHH